MTDATLVQLQENLREGDELMIRVMNELREHHEAIDDLETVARLHVVSRTALASFIAESRGILDEVEQPQTPAYVYHQ